MNPRVAATSFAAIDLGSSSVKMLVMSKGADGALTVVEDVRIGANLGKDVGADASLPAANQARALDALKRLIATAEKHGVSPARIPVIATAAVRNAPNGGDFIKRLHDELGLEQARILSGDEEAQTGYFAGLSGIDTKHGDRFVTLDLGGGSFQLAIGTASKMEKGGSTQLGSNRVQKEMLPQGRISPDDYRRADDRLKNDAPLPIPAGEMSDRTLAAVGGVSLFLRTHFGSSSITLEQIDRLRHQLGGLEPRDRIATLVDKRTDAEKLALGADSPEGALDVATKLPSKLTLLIHIMRAAGLDTLHVSDADARHLLIHRQQK